MPRTDNLPAPLAPRASLLAALAATAIAALAARAFHLQVLQGAHHAAQLDAAKAQRVILPAARGAIRDARGRVVAENRTAIDAYARLYRHPEPASLARLAALLRLDAPTLAQIRDARPDRRLLLRRDVAPDIATAIQGDDALRWVRLVPRAGRRYPFGALGAHVVGYMNEVTSAELASDYRLGDRIGRSGVERGFERALRGTPGHELRPRTRRVEVPAKGEAPIAGDDVTLTIDMDLERAAHEAFERRGVERGAAVVIEVRTGRVIAMLSRPAFDPNRVDHGVPIAAEGRPEVDHALMDITSSPGSTIKPFVALSVLAADRDGADRATTCHGSFELGARRFMCLREHGRVGLDHALTARCNVWFFEQAARLGIDALADAPQRLGLGASTGIAIGREDAGRWPTRAFYEGRGAFLAGYALNTAIGFGDVRVTPAQLAVAYAALAGDGVVRAPRIVEREVERARASGIPAADLARVRAALPSSASDATLGAIFGDVPGGARGLVASAPSQARVLAPPDPHAGEDGASTRFQLDDRWFAGFSPADAPEVAVVVLARASEGRHVDRLAGGAIAADILRARAAAKEGAR